MLSKNQLVDTRDTSWNSGKSSKLPKGKNWTPTKIHKSHKSRIRLFNSDTDARRQWVQSYNEDFETCIQPNHLSRASTKAISTHERAQNLLLKTFPETIRSPPIKFLKRPRYETVSKGSTTCWLLEK